MARNNTPVDKNSREYLLRQVANGRYSLLLIVILTVVNLIMTILDTNTYFLFSASVPYYLVFVGMGIENGFVDGAWNVKGTLTYTGLVIALVIVAVYLLCWLLSKKRAGWLTVALVLFIVDTVALVVITFALYDSPMGKLVDFLLHIWTIVELIQAVRGSKKLKALPPAGRTQERLHRPGTVTPVKKGRWPFLIKRLQSAGGKLCEAF